MLRSRWTTTVVGALLAAICLSFFHNRPDSLENLLFHIHLFDERNEREAVNKAILQYNTNCAAFYSSGGLLAGLEEIPAAPLIKRRLFKDINVLKSDGLVMVFDKDQLEVKSVVFHTADVASAETFEVWAVALQEIDTRKPVFNLKAVEVKVRYVLHKEPFPPGGERRWIIYRVDVYPKAERIPDLTVIPAL